MDINVKKSIEYAVKWWADRIDGTIQGLTFTSEFCDAFDYLKELFHMQEVDGFEESEFLLHMARQYPQYVVKQSGFVGQAKRKEFERALTALLKKDIDESGVAILHFDTERGADFTLGLAAEMCGIEHGAESPFSFEEYVFMFVDKDGVSVRYSEDELPHDLFVPKRERSF